MRPSVEEIRKAFEKAEEDTFYEVYAIRTQEQPFELGEMSHSSHEWADGEDTGEELDGVSATVASAPQIRMHASDYDTSMGYYYGEHVAIIAGTSYEYGSDEGEVVISDPVVLTIIR